MLEFKTKWLVWSVVVLLIALSVVWPAGVVDAQTALPSPTPPVVTLVVRAGGSVLWKAEDGMIVTVLGPGERLNATARSADGDWLYAETSAGGSAASGWVASDEVLVFNSEVLPVEDVTITPAPPTPVPTPTPPPATSQDIKTESVATPAATPEASASPATGAAAPSGASSAASVAVTIPLTGSAIVTVNGVNLNIRSGPGTSYPVIGKATNGQGLTVVGQNSGGDWLQVEFPASEDGTGWVAAAFVRTGQGPAPAPSAAQPDTNALAPVAQPAPGGLNGKLVLQTEFGGPIYIYHLGSGELRQVTSGFDPAISPDGTRIAFTRGGGEQGLFTINVDGSGERLIFGDRTGLWSPKWSPDGRYILFVRSDYSWKCKDYSERIGRYNCRPDIAGDGDLPYMREIRPRLARVDPDGGNYLDLATLDTASAPDWVSAGIVYASDGGIQVTSDDGKDNNRLVYFDVLQQYYQDPDWQPGGGRIVLQQRRAGHWQIFGVNPDGSGYSALTRPTTVLVDELPSSVSPAWSPNGQSIVFLSNRTPENAAGPWGVWVMNADGGNQRRLPIDLPFTYTYVEEQMVDWGP